MTFSCNNSITVLILVLFSVLTNPAISSRSSIASICESWRLTAETNNAGTWNVVPLPCVDSIESYYNNGQFYSDYNVVAHYAIAFAEKVKMVGDGKDAWIFDVDETLLSNLEYYKAHGYGSEPYNAKQFDEWIEQGKAPSFDASLKLYKALQKLGFTIFLLTGRDETQRSITEKNLREAGYFGWKQHILRGEEDQGKPAILYKSEQRTKLVKDGYKIHGSTGDQWSDLQGFAVADRSFKVPNPIYYIA